MDEMDEVDEADSMRLQSQAASLEPKAQSPKPSLVAALAALCFFLLIFSFLLFP